MAKFGNPDPTQEPVKPPVALDEIDPATKGAGSRPEFSRGSPSSSVASPQVSEAAQLARIDLETKQWQAQVAKEEEHWMKAMWRPAMGWLYMIMCLCDFVIFPIIAMFLPQFIPGMTYIPWKSITLDNGGLIHMAFGAILGVAAWTRGQEKIAGKN
jgi:hypothetical protein